MDSKIAEIISRMKRQLGPSYITIQVSDLAELMAFVADEQAKSAAKLEHQTDTLIKLTRWLFRLTWILVGLTAGLLIFTYFLVKHG
ncbi:MAG TPA: hypothetical protein VE344_05210 [Methylomirabilota bacterium]|nr:hypothetical protein [Methylomirabilota bacterium]